MFKTFRRRTDWMVYGLFGVVLLILQISGWLQRLVGR